MCDSELTNRCDSKGFTGGKEGEEGKEGKMDRVFLSFPLQRMQFVLSGSSSRDNAAFSLPLALAPHILLGINLITSTSYIAYVHIRAARQSRKSTSTPIEGTQEERESLMEEREENVGRRGPRNVQAPTGYELLLEGVQIIVVVSLVTVSIARLMAGEDKWRRIFDAGILATAVSLYTSLFYARIGS